MILLITSQKMQKLFWNENILIYTPVDGIVIPNEFREGDIIKQGQIIAKV
jgi:multidrug efflux pump subunit AcrA (membrane-fusion protein)